MADKIVKQEFGGYPVKLKDMSGYYAPVVYNLNAGGGGGDSFDGVLDAGEAHVGSVGGNTVYIDVVLTLDTNAYAAGEVVAATQAIANALRVNDGTGVLQSIAVIDQDDQKAALNIYFMSGNVSLGTENANPSITDTDALQILGPPVQIASSDYFDLGGVSVAGKDAIGKIVKAASGTRILYVAVQAGVGATPTYTASGVVLRIGILQD